MIRMNDDLYLKKDCDFPIKLPFSAGISGGESPLRSFPGIARAAASFCWALRTYGIWGRDFLWSARGKH